MKYKANGVQFFAATLAAPDEVKSTLKEILSRKEFQTGRGDISFWEKFLTKLAIWLEPFFEKLLKWLAYLNIHLDPVTLRLIVKVIAILAVLSVVFTVLYFYLGLNRKILFDIKRSNNDLSTALEPRDPEAAYALAEIQAREGNYRQALRSLYLALLLFLDTRSIISYDPAKTNWEYLEGIKGEASELAGAFSPLTRLFDRKWYGLEECKAEDYALGLQFYSDIVGRFRP